MNARASGRARDRRAKEPAHPLYHDVPLRHVRELAVLGVPVRFESNSAALINAADATFGIWRRTRGVNPRGRAGIRVRLILHQGDEGPGRHIRIAYRLPDVDRIVMQTPGSLAIADARRREGIAYVTPAFLARLDHLCFGILEPLVLVLVTLRDRHPVHAAVIRRGGAALVLAGPAGTGKSTLAYAAMRAGLTVLADDSAYVQVRPTLHVWGMPGRLFLPPDVRRWFPELARLRPRRLATGKTKLAVDAPRPLGNHGLVATRVGVCLLERRKGPARLTRIGAPALKRALWRGLGVQQPIHRATAGPALARLCAGGGWRLNLSGPPGDAVRYLDRMLAEVARLTPRAKRRAAWRRSQGRA